ncbi:MAG: DUF4215 domain-containing protein [Pseudomonadota bacterium]
MSTSDGVQQRSQPGWIGVQKWEVIISRALSIAVILFPFLSAVSCGWFGSNPVVIGDGETQDIVDDDASSGDMDRDRDPDGEAPDDAGHEDEGPTDLPGEEEAAECTDDEDCLDANACNGDETCNLSTHRCESGAPLDDGTVCLDPPRKICLDAECVDSVCGDCFTDRGNGEFCDDCNDDPADGCHECVLLCSENEDCDDDEACNGEETCDIDEARCENGVSPADGTVCLDAPRSICLRGACGESVCGDGYWDEEGGEQCEGNPPGSCTSACGTGGTETCESCAWVCTPPDELCNGEDDDCDGEPDNGFECAAGETDDACETCGGTGGITGSRTCSGGCEWGDCCSQDDFCNDCDDDCDGETDEIEIVETDIRVTNAPAYSGAPSMAYNPAADEFGIAWHDGRSGMSSGEIMFARISPAGEKLSADIQITDNWAASLFPSLVYTGSEYGVAWEDSMSAYTDIFFTRIDDEGGTIGPVIQVTNATYSSDLPSLVYTGSEYGLAWDDARDTGGSGNLDRIYFAKLDDEGSKTTGDIMVTSRNVSSDQASLVFTGSRFAIAWRDNRSGNQDVYFTIFDMDGATIVDDARITDASTDSTAPALAFTGSEYGVAWLERRGGAWGAWYARIDEEGGKIGSDIRISDAADGEFISSYVLNEAPLVWDPGGSVFGFSWTDDRDGNLEVYFTRFTHDGTLVDAELRMSNANDHSVHTTLAHGDGQWAVAWRDFRIPPDSEIFAGIAGCLPMEM